MPATRKSRFFRGTPPQRIMGAIEAHTNFPSSASISLMTRIPVGTVETLRSRYDYIADAMRAKVRELIPRVPHAELFTHVANAYCSSVHELANHRAKVIRERIDGYTGRPSLANLATHVTGAKGTASSIITRDPAVKQLALARIFHLLAQMSLAQITAERLDRNTVPEISAHIAKMKLEQSVKKKNRIR